MAQISSLGLLGIPFPYRTIAAKAAAVVASSGGLIAKAKPRKQWYELPNGIRVYATSERFARIAAQYEIAKKLEPSAEETTEPAVEPAAEIAAGTPIVVERAPVALPIARQPVALLGEPVPAPVALPDIRLAYPRPYVAPAEAKPEPKSVEPPPVDTVALAAEQAERDRVVAEREEEELIVHLLLMDLAA